MLLPHVSCKVGGVTTTKDHTIGKKMEYEFGWNDPPSSAYSAASKSTSSKLTHLPRRPPSDATTTTTTPSTVTAPPPSLAPPPTTTIPIHLRIGGSKKTSDSDIPIKEDDNAKCNDIDFTEVVDKLNYMTESLQERLQKKVYDDIKRRLNLLAMQSKNDKLSPAVRLKTSQLVAAMEDKDFETADSLQVGLMVDHVSEVSQWLVGVKKLIFTLKSEK